MENYEKTIRQGSVSILIALIISIIFYKYVLSNWDLLKQFLF